MHNLSLEDLIEHFVYEDINLSRQQLGSIITLYDPSTSDLISFERDSKFYIVRHLFNKPQKEKYFKRKNDFVFADIVLSCVN